MSALLARLLLAAAALAGAASEKDGLIGSFVRSDRWEVRRSGAERIEEFTGHVRYRRGSRTLRSDWALYDHKSRRFKARGSVVAEVVLDGGDRVTVFGERASHDLGSDRGELLPAPGGRVRFLRERSDGGRDAGSADRLSWDWAARQVTLEGRAEAQGPEGSAKAERARYDLQAETLTLEGGRPVLNARQEGWTAAGQGDRIVARRRPAKVEGEGRSRGWVRFKDGIPGTVR